LRPSPPVDPLEALDDPDLGERLKRSHPHLFARSRHRDTPDDETDRPLEQEVSRILAIVGLIIAALACYALGAIMRSRMSEDVSPLVRTLAPRVAQAAGLGEQAPGLATGGPVAAFGPPPASHAGAAPRAA
jgi:hypothetical protein